MGGFPFYFAGLGISESDVVARSGEYGHRTLSVHGLLHYVWMLRDDDQMVPGFQMVIEQPWEIT